MGGFSPHPGSFPERKSFLGNAGFQPEKEV